MNVDDALVALTKFTRIVLQSLPSTDTQTSTTGTNQNIDSNDDIVDNDEWDYESSFPEFQETISQTHASILSLIQQILQIQQQLEGDHNAADINDTNNDSTGATTTTATAVDFLQTIVLRQQQQQQQRTNHENYHDNDDMNDPMIWEQCMDYYEVLIQEIESYLQQQQQQQTNSSNGNDHDNIGKDTNKKTFLMEHESLLVKDKPQDRYTMSFHYCNTSQQHTRTIPFIPKLIPPLPFHHSSNNTNMKDIIQLKVGNGYSSRYGKLRSSLSSSNTTTGTGSNVLTDVSQPEQQHFLLEPTHYCEHVYRTEIEQLQYNISSGSGSSSSSNTTMTQQQQQQQPIQLQVATSKEALPTIHVIDITTSSTIPYTYIDTELQLRTVTEFIQQRDNHINTIAFDIEAHSYRTFSGIVCLLQMSFYATAVTGSGSDTSNTSVIQNYIIDTLVLHDYIHTYINPIMVNPNILKIFHGADMDIQWLQRDFGIYVVHLFDTYRATKYMNEYCTTAGNISSGNNSKNASTTPQFTSVGYAGIVKYYCNNTYTIDKQHQLSDWRIRPLPDDMIQYAVQDTYYLITIYEHIKYDLYHTCNGYEAITDVLDISKNVSLIRYCPTPFDPYGYRSLLLPRRSPKVSTTSVRKRQSTVTTSHHMLTQRQEIILKTLWDWRDMIARIEDESIFYVCSNAQLLRIVYSIHIGDGNNISTISASQLLSIFHSTSSSRSQQQTPPLLNKYASDISRLLQNTINNESVNILSTTITTAEVDEEVGDEDDLDEDDEEVVNSGLSMTNSDIPAALDASHNTVVTTTSVVPSRTTGSAFFKPAAMKSLSSSSGGIVGNTTGLTVTTRSSSMTATTPLDPSRLRHITTTATSMSEADNTTVERCSPVLGTEALYEQAGWMTPSDTIQRKGKVFPKGINQQLLVDAIPPPANVAGESVPTVSNNYGGGVEHDNTKPKKLLSVHESNQEYRSDLYGVDSLRIKGTTVDGSFHAAGMTAPVITVVSDATLEQELKNARDNGNLINQGSTSNWKEAIPAVLGLVAAKGDNDDDDDDIDDDENEDEKARQGQDTIANGRTSDSIAKADLEEEFVIPRSIREIYMISNRNRRNKKAGSPTPERGVTPTNEKERLALAQAEALLLSRGDAVARYFNDETSSGKRQKQSIKSSTTGRESEETLPIYDSSVDVASKEDDLNFMKSIGWIPNSAGTSVEEFLNQRPTNVTTAEQSYEEGNNATNTNEQPIKPVAIDPTIAQIGVIHPASQQLWNSGSSTNPFFSGVAAQGGGPLQQQRNVGGSAKSAAAFSSSTTNRGGKLSNNATAGSARNSGSTTTGSTSSNANTNRQLERPDRKESRTFAYRKR